MKAIVLNIVLNLASFISIVALSSSKIYAHIIVESNSSASASKTLFFKSQNDLEKYVCPIDVLSPSPKNCTKQVVVRKNAEGFYK
ncbi:MAG: hypothetical protein NT027_19905 [Proteobacteria bacterium]|nr:hypothetical protein [Pseudomonadota bacterium]